MSNTKYHILCSLVKWCIIIHNNHFLKLCRFMHWVSKLIRPLQMWHDIDNTRSLSLNIRSLNHKADLHQLKSNKNCNDFADCLGYINSKRAVICKACDEAHLQFQLIYSCSEISYLQHTSSVQLIYLRLFKSRHDQRCQFPNLNNERREPTTSSR